MARATKSTKTGAVSSRSESKSLTVAPAVLRSRTVKKSGAQAKQAPRGARRKDALAPNVVDIGAIRQSAVERRAVERLVRIDEMRDASKLLKAGQSQREIAETLRTTQPRVHRMLRAMDARGAVEITPEEVILRAVVDHADREALIDRLAKMDYTFGKAAPGGMDGGISGSWDQVRLAVRNGLLTRDEFERVSAAVKPPKP